MAALTGKVAIVTGSSRGIGRGIAERLGRDGASVVVNYSGSEQEANDVVNAIAATGGKSVAIQASLSKVADIRRLFAETLQYFGQLDILVNNAGTGIVSAIAPDTMWPALFQAKAGYCHIRIVDNVVNKQNLAKECNFSIEFFVRKYRVSHSPYH